MNPNPKGCCLLFDTYVNAENRLEYEEAALKAMEVGKIESEIRQLHFRKRLSEIRQTLFHKFKDKDQIAEPSESQTKDPTPEVGVGRRLTNSDLSRDVELKARVDTVRSLFTTVGL